SFASFTISSYIRPSPDCFTLSLHDALPIYTHLPLSKWFIAIYLMTESKKGMSALQIKRTLCVAYETAWYLCHRIRAAMREINSEDRKSTRLNSSHEWISYAVFCLTKKIIST